MSLSDLSYPIYYDLEQWTWIGHTPPTDPNVYDDIVNTWYGVLQSSGYQNLVVYSYTSYLQGPLNHSNIYSKTTWVVQYGATMGFNSFPTNSRGWQYTSSGQIDGIDGNVDMNAFGNKDYVSGGSDDDVVTYEVKGDMGKEWQSIGAEKSVIGKPIANEVCDWTSGRVNCYQNFENGAISWTPSTEAHYTTGEVRKEWARRNYEHGVLGYPIEDEKTLSNNWICQSFEHGYVWVQGTDTKYIVLYNLRDSFDENGGYAVLGGPGANEENMGDGYWRQRCENGDVWTRNGSSEKYVVMYNLREEYYS